MSIVNATATYTPRGDAGQFVSSRVTPAARASVEASAQFVLAEARAIVAVDTGQLRDSGKIAVEQTGKIVRSHVVFDAPHAMYVEFGTGVAGAASPGAGPFDYDPSWPGMPSQPFLRPALDSAREVVKELFKSNIALEFKL